jgi:hypothetical protein
MRLAAGQNWSEQQLDLLTQQMMINKALCIRLRSTVGEVSYACMRS